MLEGLKRDKGERGGPRSIGYRFREDKGVICVWIWENM